MDNRARFNREKISKLRFWQEEGGIDRIEYGEKDTRREKLLKTIAEYQE
jgi:hypothetical protein